MELKPPEPPPGGVAKTDGFVWSDVSSSRGDIHCN